MVGLDEGVVGGCIDVGEVWCDYYLFFCYVVFYFCYFCFVGGQVGDWWLFVIVVVMGDGVIQFGGVGVYYGGEDYVGVCLVDVFDGVLYVVVGGIQWNVDFFEYCVVVLVVQVVYYMVVFLWIDVV